MLITVFTPTYNRAHLLVNLFDSLKMQCNSNFEWVVVDDGSMDHTEEIVKGYLSEDLAFSITYIKQSNAGKHIAINSGVKLAKGELFFIVDSDDYLAPDAIEKIIKQWESVNNLPGYIGVAGNRCFQNGTSIGNPHYNTLDCSPIEFRYIYGEKGDKAEVIKTSIFKENPFPVTQNEKFCPEAIFFNRLGDYKLRYFNENIYYCEYIEGGLTANIVKIRKLSPINTSICYYEMANLPIPFKERMKAAINFYRFSRYTKQKLKEPFQSKLLQLIASVSGTLISLKD